MTNVSFIHGCVAMGCLVAAGFFFRFWQQSRDRLFQWFAWAFLVLAISYVLLGLIQLATESRVYVFVLRLIAFNLILYGIYEKNTR